MNAPRPAFPAPRVAPNLSHAFGGIWRLTFRRFLQAGHWLTVGIGLVVMMLLFTGGPRHDTPAQFLDWAINFYLTFLVPVLAFMAGGGAMRDEMKSGTVDYVLTRPVSRPAFVAFKYLAHTLCTQINFLPAFAVVVAFAVFREVPNLASVIPQLLLGQILLVAAFGGLGFLSGALAVRYVIIGLVYAGVVEVGVGQIPTQLSRLSMTHQVRALLAPLWDKTVDLTTVPGWPASAAILLAFGAVTVAATAALLAFRELSGPSDV